MNSKMVIVGVLFLFFGILCVPSDVWANRKQGFLLRLGAGAGASFQAIDNNKQTVQLDRQRAFVFATNFKLGRSFSEHSILYLMYRTNSRSLFDEQQSILGLELNYYMKGRMSSIFLVGGIGWANWMPENSGSNNHEGMGAAFGVGSVFGVGYEIDDESNVEVNVLLNKDRIFSISAILNMSLF